MMSETPTSIRNIPSDALQIAQDINRRTGLSVADVLRQAMVPSPWTKWAMGSSVARNV